MARDNETQTVEDDNEEFEGNEPGEGDGSEETPAEGSTPTDKPISGLLKNTLAITWDAAGTDDAPVTRVTLRGELVFDVAEFETPAGETIYRSGLFRTDQQDEKDAIAVALKNGVNRAFTAAWNEIYPPEKRERAQREKLSEKNARQQVQIDQMAALQAELMDALLNGRKPSLANLVSMGIDENRLRELGVDPAAFDGVTEGDESGNDGGDLSQNGATTGRRSASGRASRG